MSEQTRHADQHGHAYVRDEDGGRLYDQPEDWSLDKNPDEMNVKELAAAAAQLLGCRPKWWPYYKDWCCDCRDNRHGCDQQCSAIADYSGDAKYARQIALLMERRGVEVLKATAGPNEICRAALRALAPKRWLH